MDLREIKILHEDYLSRVKEFLGKSYKADASTRPLGTFYLLKQIEKEVPNSLGEFGTGFTTLVMKLFFPHLKITSFDNNPKWIEFMKTILEDYELPSSNVKTIEKLVVESRMLAAPIYDMVFVDHNNPTLADRWNDLPWIMSLLKPEGTAILDDWWAPGFRAFNGTKRGIRVMTRLGFNLNVIEESRPSPGDKAICIAKR